MESCKDSTSSYRSIFKAITLFGGVQLWKILITLVQTKFIAILLGPEGMGIKGLYNSATDLIRSLTSLGLTYSAVRDVSEAYGTGNTNKVSYVISLFFKLIRFTSILGMGSIIILSPILSKSTFGSYDYTIPFIVLSTTLFIAQYANGYNVLLQGSHKLTYLAKAGLWGSIASLLITIPLYYFFGINGIVPALVFNEFTLFLLSRYYGRKVKVEKVKVTLKEAFYKGRQMIGMGVVMTFNSILVLGVAYIIRIMITRDGGVGDVGLFNAGFAVINTYVGLVFSAMGADYYPRLAAVNNDNQKCREIVNKQIEVGLLLIGPLMTFFLMFAPLAVIAIYSDKFLPIVGYMKWASIGIVVQVFGWSIAYQFIAKGNMKFFGINETIINIVNLVLSIIFYKLWGITGLGITFLTQVIIYFIMVFIVSNRYYHFKLTSDALKIGLIMMTCVVSVFLLLTLCSHWIMYIPAALLLAVTCIFSFRELDKRMNLRQVLVEFKNKRK